MANTSVLSSLAYGWETTYGTAASTIDKPFGHGVRVTSLSRNNNTEKIQSVEDLHVQKFVAKGYEGSLGVEFFLANPWFFKAILGSVSTSGTGPYDHTFSEANSLPSITVQNNINTDTAKRFNLLGGVVASASITAAINEVAKVSLQIPFANEAESTATFSSTQETFDVFTFAEGTLELPSGTTLAKVQNVGVNITNDVEIIKGLGSRFGQEATLKGRTYTGSVTMAFQDPADLLELFYGGSTGPQDSVSEQANMRLKFTNGLTGTNERTIELNFTGVFIDEESLPQEPGQAIMEDVSISMRNLQVIATNNTSTAQ